MKGMSMRSASVILVAVIALGFSTEILAQNKEEKPSAKKAKSEAANAKRGDVSANKPGTSQVQGVVAVLPKGSKWTGQYFATDPGNPAALTATITSAEGNVATMEWMNQNGRWQSHLERRGDQIAFLDCVGIDGSNGPNTYAFESIDIKGAIPGGNPLRFQLTGNWNVRHMQGDRSVKTYRSRWELTCVDNVAGTPGANASGEANQMSKSRQDSRDLDPTSELTKNSVWRGQRWHKDPSGEFGPQESLDVKVTMREVGQDANRATFQAVKWDGVQGQVNFTVTISGNRVLCKSITYSGGGAKGRFENVDGEGIITGNNLEFVCRANIESPEFNGPFAEKFNLKLGK